MFGREREDNTMMMRTELKTEELALVNGGSRTYVCPDCGETHYTIQSIVHHCETEHKHKND